jgi:DNA-directed RNA polymerase subunit RPC12/RpoP
MAKKYIKLTVIPQSETNERQVIIIEGKGTVAVKGKKGQLNYTCGNCGAVLIEDIDKNTNIMNIVIKCNRCGLFNDTKHYSVPNPN